MKTRYVSFDYFRAISIILVMFYHYPQVNNQRLFGSIGQLGLYAIDWFFVLSGFLISQQVFQSLKNTDKNYFTAFYIKRIFKTWPSYYAVVWLYFQFPVLQERPHLPPIEQLLTFTQNFHMEFGAFAVSWSICVEEHFYLIFPILTYFLIGKGKHKWFLSALGALILVGLVSRNMIWNEHLSSVGDWTARKTHLVYLSKIHYPTVNRMDGIVLGILLGYFNFFCADAWKMIQQKYLKLLSVLAVAFLGLGLLLNKTHVSELSTTFRFLTTSIGFFFLCMFGLMIEQFFKKVQSNTIQYLSTISYALYLTHWPAFHSARLILSKFDYSADRFVEILFSFTLALIFAGLVYYIVEFPFMKLRGQILNTLSSKTQ